MTPRARLLGGLLAALLTVGLVAAPAAAAGRSVTVAGSFQSEAGCPGDWQPACSATDLTRRADGTYTGTFALPAGSYEFKVAIDHAWDESYGSRTGDDIPLVLLAPATLRFTYDDTTHLTVVAPTDLPGAAGPADRGLGANSLRTLLTREQFYFVMADRFANGTTANDTGGLTGSRLATGYDPTDKGFFHGGDLKGLTQKLDYIKGLGTTALWLTPSFTNRPVQGSGEDASAGYHGYWVTDFTTIDPHLGTNADMKALIAAAHKKGMKVFFDIITNHTADVIDYAQKQYSYVPKAEKPYTTANGTPFDDADYVNQPFPPLDASSFPYTPVYDDPADATAKTPAWLNDVTLYHNRGDSTFAGESSTYGDFSGLDDLFTENPKVVEGMEDIYKAWVDFGIDGFRIDTVKHVNLGFWQKFAPAMLAEAQAVDNPDFFMFGEVYDADPAYTSTFSTSGRLPATLDFGFQAQAVATANGGPTSALQTLFAGDDYYTDADSNAYNLPTFLGNHDMGRVGLFVGGSMPKDLFAHALMFTLRGQPVVYYGDEQGFTGPGGDKDARQDMFASQVPSYNADVLVGQSAPMGSKDRYDTTSQLYKEIQQLSKLRQAHPGLLDGAQIPRFASNQAGIFAVSRVDRAEQREYLVVANNAATAKTATFPTYTAGARFAPLYGGGSAVAADKQGTVTVTVPPMTVRVLQADRDLPRSPDAPKVYAMSPLPGAPLSGRQEIRAAVPADQLTQVSVGFRAPGQKSWTPLGTDDNAPYRVFHDVSGYAEGTVLEYRIVARDNAGHLSATSTYGVVGDPLPTAGAGVGPVAQPTSVTVAGSLDSEIGCPGDWQPDCAAAHLTLDPADKIWKGSFALPAGTYEYKVAIADSWTENYGKGAAKDGANIPLTVPAGGATVTFWYDHRTHVVQDSLQGKPVVAAGSFQSEVGCAGDWDPGCMASWLQDPDGDGTWSLSLDGIPAGSYEVKAAVGLSWDENYGAGGVANGPNIGFTVPSDGLTVTFAYTPATHVLTVTTGFPPDLTQKQATWVDDRTVSYPLDRLPAGTDRRWLRWRLHWGSDVALDLTSVGGTSVALRPVGVADGRLLLRLPAGTKRSTVSGAPAAAVAAYDDAQRLTDATGLG